jgi:hypothetical protein
MASAGQHETKIIRIIIIIIIVVVVIVVSIPVAAKYKIHDDIFQIWTRKDYPTTTRRNWNKNRLTDQGRNPCSTQCGMWDDVIIRMLIGSLMLGII